MWEGDSITDLGTLGGEGWNTPMALNSWGDVVGFANAPGTPVDQFVPIPFLWTRSDGIKPLPLLTGDDNGQALGINVWRQIVGVSCAGSICRGVLWEHGEVVDLSHGRTGWSAPSSMPGTSTTGGGLAASPSTRHWPHHRVPGHPCRLEPRARR